MAKTAGSVFIDEIMHDMDRADNLTTDTVYRGKVLRWLNRVLKDIVTKQVTYPWRFLEKTSTFLTVADQMTYDLPPDCDSHKILGVKCENPECKLTYIEQGDLDTLVPDPTVSKGNPNWYSIYANSFRLFPIPSTAGQVIYVRYIKNITALADDTTTTDLPEKYDEVLLNGAMAKAMLFDSKDPSFYQSLYDRGIQDMIDDNFQMIERRRVLRSHGRQQGYLKWESPAGI